MGVSSKVLTDDGMRAANHVHMLLFKAEEVQKAEQPLTAVNKSVDVKLSQLLPPLKHSPWSASQRAT